MLNVVWPQWKSFQYQAGKFIHSCESIPSSVVQCSVGESSMWPMCVTSVSSREWVGVCVWVSEWVSAAAPMASCIEFHDVISVNDIVPMHNAQV